MPSTLVLIGGGKMGGALLEGWLQVGINPANIFVVEPYADSSKALAELGVTVVATPEDLANEIYPDIIVFAVKPQMMDSVVPVYKKFSPQGALFISIAAGITIGFFENRLGAGTAVVRCMPNLPGSIHRGISGAFAGSTVSAAQRNRAQELLEAVGEVVWVENEALIDVVTAVSGSGPAYVFLLSECLAQAGVEAGMPPDLAERLARATICGAGALLDQSGESAETLRQNVTSPGGTTAAALEDLMAEDGLCSLMRRAVARATARSRELSID
jgi:pyrroline-5-carboxylate reductase